MSHPVTAATEPCVVELETHELAKTVGMFLYRSCEIVSDDQHVLRIFHEDGVEQKTFRISPSNGTCTFKYRSHTCKYVTERVATPVASNTSDYAARHSEHVTLHAPNARVVNDICVDAYTMRYEDKKDHFQVFNYVVRGGWWRRVAFVSHRNIDTVIAEQSAVLQSDVDNFLKPNTRDWFLTHCIPYKRGYLFHGPPGTGKSSMIAALASKHERRVYSINVSANDLDDGTLLDAFNAVVTGSIIAIEDIDAVFNNHREKVSGNNNVTFSGLINAIDGVSTCTNGTIFIFTTNHLDRLDHALIRAGRVDLKVEFGALTRATATLMFKRFYPEALPCTISAFTDSIFKTNAAAVSHLNPADLQEHFIQHREKPAHEATTFVAPRSSTNAPHRDMWM